MSEKETSIRDELKKEGYSKEEEYFYRVNRELIEKRRKQLDEKRLEQKTNGSQYPYWMKCPKCGSPMKEISLSGIWADQCAACQGIYFDHGEFETLLEAKKPKQFLKGVLNRFRAKLSQFDTEWRP